VGVPIAVVLGAITASGNQTVVTAAGEHVAGAGGGLLAGLAIATALMFVVRVRYPRWWFEFARELTRFGTRVGAYVGLLTDRYPSTVDAQSLHLEIDYPDVDRDLNRWLPLVEWLLAIPHYVAPRSDEVASVCPRDGCLAAGTRGGRRRPPRGASNGRSPVRKPPMGNLE